MPSILLLNDLREHANWGSQALSEGLNRLLAATVSQATVTMIPHHWLDRAPRSDPADASRPSRWKRLRDRQTDRFPFTPQVVDEYEAAAELWLTGRAGPGATEFVAELRRADLFLVNAEGFTYRVNRMAVNGLFLAWLAKVKLDVQTLFVNATVALTHVDPILPAMVRKSLGAVDEVSVREPCSLRNLAAFAPSVKAELIPDTAFYLLQTPLPSPSERLRELVPEGRPYFCFSHSNLPMDYVRTRRRSSLLHLIRRLQEVVPDGMLMAKVPGNQYLRDLAAETGCTFIGPTFTYWDVMHALRGASFLVTGRYHQAILAAMMGCPVIPLSTTSHKMDGLCELLEGEIGTPFDATDLWSWTDPIVDVARRYTDELFTRREKMRALTQRLSHSTADLGEMVSRSLP